MYKGRAILLCLLEAFLFVGVSNSSGPVMLLNIVKGIHRNQTSIPLMVVEAIVCLDRHHHSN